MPVMVNGPQFPQDPEGIFDRRRRRGVQEGKLLNITEPQVQHAEDDFGQVGAQDLGRGEARPGEVVVLGIEADTDAGFDPAAPALPLIGAGLGNRRDRQALGPRARVVLGHASQAGIDHIPDAGNGDRGFRHVGGDHDLFLRGELKDALLIGRGQPSEEGQDDGLPVAFFFKALHGLPNIAFRRHEDEDIAAAPEVMTRLDEVHRGHRLVDVAGVILILGRLGRLVPHLDREGAA